VAHTRTLAVTQHTITNSVSSLRIAEPGRGPIPCGSSEFLEHCLTESHVVPRELPKFPGLESQGRTWQVERVRTVSCNGIHRGGLKSWSGYPPPDTTHSCSARAPFRCCSHRLRRRHHRPNANIHHELADSGMRHAICPIEVQIHNGSAEGIAQKFATRSGVRSVELLSPQLPNQPNSGSVERATLSSALARS